MRIHEKLLKPVMETKYLTVENAARYRSIIRLFYLNYEKLKYWMYREEVYQELMEDPYFHTYTMEQCQKDLSALVGWGNLSTIQDTRKVASIEEFKNKKFRYQLSETAVEIERMAVRLENLFIEGSSLEPTLLERLRMSLTRIEETDGMDPEKAYGWWNDLNNDFIRLNQNYQDYMRELNSVKAEEMMRTREFLVFKDRLIEYLRSFVKSLQENVPAIEEHLGGVDVELVERLLKKVTGYELSIPRIDVELDEDTILERMRGRWDSIREWFGASSRQESEVAKVFDTTNEIIRKITRYAARISEQNNTGANRREEYHKIAQMFGKCEDIMEAHRLAACVFGIEKPLHLKGNITRETDSINSGVFEETPHAVTVTLRVRNYREKTERTGIEDKSREKEAMCRETIRRIEEERRLLESYIRDGRLEFAALPQITAGVRDVFLVWLSKALSESRFGMFSWEEILTAYFGGPLLANQERREREMEQRQRFFREIACAYGDGDKAETKRESEGAAAGESNGEADGKRQALLWLEGAVQGRCDGRNLLMQQYREDARLLRQTLLTVLQAIPHLPCMERGREALGQLQRELLPVFAARVTGTPHYFDVGSLGEKILTAFLREYFQTGKSAEIWGAEWHNSLYYQAGLLKDDLSNDVLVYGIHARKTDGTLHRGIEGFCGEGQPMRLTLQTIGGLQEAWAGQADHPMPIYVVENPAVFSQLIRRCPQAAALCGSGQPRMAALALMDLLAAHGYLYYAGDFDPDGLLILQRLKTRYQEKLIPWGYYVEWYEKHVSDVALSDPVLKKLEKVNLAEVWQLKESMLRKKRAAYQEAMLEELMGEAERHV